MSDSSDNEKRLEYPDEKGAQDFGHGEVVAEDHGADSELQRRLSTRHITMIALGSSIGMGLWLGSGSSLASGGPAAIFIGYLLSGTMIWSVSHSIGEMAVMYPLPSAVCILRGVRRTSCMSDLYDTPSSCNGPTNSSIQPLVLLWDGPTGSLIGSRSPTNCKVS